MKPLTRRTALRGATLATIGGYLMANSSVARANDHGYPDADDVDISDDNIDYIVPDPDAGFYHPYLLYVPLDQVWKESPETRPLFVEPNARQTDGFDSILDSAINNIRSGSWQRELADELSVPILYPLLPGQWVGYYQFALDYRALITDDPVFGRYDLQVLAMVDDVQERLTDEPYEIADKIHLNGASSSATFTTRFAILHPERVNAFSAGATAQFTLPKKEVDDEVPAIHEPDTNTLLYPAGVGDLEELIGEPFNKDAWKEIGKFLFVGGDDRPNPEEDSRSYRGFGNLPKERDDQVIAVFGTERVDERFEVSRSVYQAVDPSAQFTIYEGYGHTDRPAVNDLMQFHRQHIREEFGSKGGLEDPEVIAEEIPGFGALQGIAALGGLGYLIKQRSSRSE